MQEPGAHGKGVSKMHGCYNAVGLWFLDGLAAYDDVAAAAAAFRAAVEAASADLTWVRGEREVPEGVAASSWSVVGGFAHNVTVPPNARARVLIPAHSQGDVTEGGAPVRLAAGVVVVGPATVNGVPYLEGGVRGGGVPVRVGVALSAVD